MLLSEIFDQLHHGELSSLDLGGDEEGDIIAENYPRVISHINLALTALYKLFPLSTGTVTITQDEAVSKYYLDSAYSAVTGTASTLYLIDTVAEPFVDNVLKIETIYDEDGDICFFNEASEVTSMFNVDFDSFTVPNPVTGENLQVKYRADHEAISINEADSSAVNVRISRALMEPLLFYVASRAFASSPPLEGVDRSAQYLAKFEASVMRIKDLDLVNDEEQANEKLDDNGWP